MKLESREREWRSFSHKRRKYLSDMESFNAGWQAAERDTRERVAKLARDIAKEVGGNFAATHRLNVGLNEFIKELERIRGKE